jgi:myo-inositol-1(or 4)-monophosphatase
MNYTALKGKGAFLNGKTIRVNKKDSLKESLLVTGFPYDLTEVKLLKQIITSII